MTRVENCEKDLAICNSNLRQLEANFYTTEGNLVADQCFNNDTLLEKTTRS